MKKFVMTEKFAYLALCWTALYAFTALAEPPHATTHEANGIPLSVEPESLWPIGEEPNDEGFFSKTQGELADSVDRMPWLWGALTIIGSYLGYQSGKRGLSYLFTQLTQYSSKPKVIGYTVFIAGILAITNAVTMAFGLSYVFTNLLMSGVLTAIFGFGVATSNRGKDEYFSP